MADFSRVANFEAEALVPGTANAIAFWFTVKLRHDASVTSPSAHEASREPGWFDLCSYPAEASYCGAAGSSRCWSQAIHFLQRPCQVHASKTLRIEARHGPTRMSFKVSNSSD